MAYQRFMPSFVPSRFEAQAMLIERQEETRLLQLQLVEEQNQRSDAFRAEIGERFFNLEAMMKNHCNQASISPIRPHETNFSPSIIPITPSQPPQPPDPPDYKTKPTSKASTTKKIPLRYSCEEIYERMEKGFCIFCEDLDTPGHYNLKHKGSKLSFAESVGDESRDDEKRDEITVEEISNKSLNMIREKESNLENESRPEVSVSQFQVPFSSREPSRRCHKTHNHYESLDVVDKDMCDEPVCGKDGDYIPTVSAKFREKYEDPRFELVSLKQSHDYVENYLGSFEYALTRSLLQYTPTYQYRAPFNPYQNSNDQCHYKREFGNLLDLRLSLIESEEIEDDELQDKQPEEDVDTLVISENEQSLECVDDESSVDEKLIEVIAEETALEPMDESGCNFYKERNLNNMLCQSLRLLHFEESSDTTVPCLNLETKALSSLLSVGGIMLLSDSKQQSLLDPYADLPCSWHISSDMVCGFLQPLLIVAINSRMIFVSSGIIFVDDIVVTLRNTLEDKSVLRMEEVCIEGIKHNLEFAIDRGWVEYWINTHVFTLRNSGLRLSSSEYTKNTLILVYLLCTLSSSRLFVKTYAGCVVALLMVSDAERLIQSVSPLIFSDLLYVKNRIRVRLKMVLLLEFLWLILFTSKMFKSSSVPQNKNQTDQKLSSYWKLLLRLLHPLHINRWRSFYLLVIKSLFKGKEETASSNSAVTSCSMFGFFPYPSSSCALRQENCVLVLFTIVEDLTIFNDQHTLVAEKNGTETPIVLKLIFCRATHQLLLKQSLFQVLLHIQNRDCNFFGYMLVTTSDCFGTLLEIPDKEIAKPHRIFFLRILIQWKWYPPTQAIRSFTKPSMTRQKAWPRILPTLHLGALSFSALRTSLFSTGEYCNRIYSLPLYLSIIANQ